MAIPNNITRNHVLEVINQIENGRQIPAKRLPRRVALRFNNENYPVKILISWSSEIFSGEELNYNLFITNEAIKYLTDLGFEIVRF